MDWTDTEEQATFRSEVQTLIEDKVPTRYREMARRNHREMGYPWAQDRASGEPQREHAAQEWFEAVSEKGWIAPHWPKEYGGGGFTPMEQYIYNAELATANVPAPGSNVGIGMLGPALIVHGTDEQKQRFLPPILKGEVVWSQGFSEPAAGSDLASLQTRAVRDGDEFVVNGQKIWTSHAHYADWVLLLTRTDPQAPKHRGISFLLLDIRSPGVSVRPIIDMAWGHEVNETFYEDVRVPVDQMVGEENRGWYVAMTLLDNERSNVTGAIMMERQIRRLIDDVHVAGSDRSRVGRYDAVRQEIAERFVECGVMMNFSLRIITIQAANQVPNYEASVAKMFGSEAAQRMTRTGMKAYGLYANLWDPADDLAPMEASFTRGYVRSVPGTIAAGSSEIQRNVIATRGLGLPRG
ncbi:MAG: acyl-CoA dehydrogenase family protein [Chloroflexi bacterium]|nr:acyl-CoA dehydrogenase family protein [Chloroflexota bacterium]